MPDTSYEFEFVEELPPVNRARNNVHGQNRNPRLVAFAEALRQRPGKWAKWPHQNSVPGSIAGSVKSGQYPSFPKGHFEAVVRDKQVYVRYPLAADPSTMVK